MITKLTKKTLDQIEVWLKLEHKHDNPCPFGWSGAWGDDWAACKGVCAKMFPKVATDLKRVLAEEQHGYFYDPLACPCTQYSLSYVKQKARAVVAAKGVIE